MQNEFEVVSHSQFQYLNVFLVHLLYRTPHIHRDLEIGAILEGSVRIRIGNRSWELRENDIYLINSMEAHEFFTEDTGTLVLAIQVSPKLLTPFLPNAERYVFSVDPPLRDCFAHADYKELLALCAELALQYLAKPPHYELFCYRQILSILYLLSTGLPAKILSRRGYLPLRRRADRMVEITDFIDQNYQRKLLLDEIAEEYGLTRTYLSHLFKDTLGVSFQEYLKEKRFEYAFMQITTTDKSILDISMESGFSDARYLNQMFENKMGCQPKEYRKQMQAAKHAVNIRAENLQYFLPEDTALSVVEAWKEHCAPDTGLYSPRNTK